MKKMLAVALIVIAGLFMLSAPNVMAQEPCSGDFDCDGAVAANDVAEFLNHFGRSYLTGNPCPSCQESPCPCTVCPYGMVDCGTKCVDPQTDGDFCGADSECIGGIVCGASEKCVAGVCEIVGGGVYQAAVEKTGQTTSYYTGDDGDLEKGVAWPNPRFMDNLDGTVTDNLTGLVWLKDANCFGTRTWHSALSDANGLASGSCGLTDGSGAGDWRLPQIKELQSLIDFENYYPALPTGHPFNNVQSSYYWSSSTVANGTGYAWYVCMGHGDVYYYNKTSNNCVWPVRGGQ